MSEVLLEALMQLFALLTDVKHAASAAGRSKVGEFLYRQFNAEYVKKFLQRYDFYLQKFHSQVDPADNEAMAKQTQDNMRKLRVICADVNREIDIEEKVLLLSSMLNYIAKPDFTQDEERFVDTLADELRIPPDDYWNLKTFTLQDPSYVVDKSRLLVINGKAEKPHPDLKHIYISKFGVCVWVLHIKCTNSFFFRYNGDRNLYLSGHKLDAAKVYRMSPGGVINTSHVRPVYYGHIAEKFITRPDTGRIVYRAVDLEYKFSDGAIGVHRFSYLGKSGQLVGIMGGSGSGKSTLMNLLCGKLKPSKGQITINGYDLNADHKELEGVIGFVPQDDMLNEELTVYENLWFNARLIFSNKSHQDKVALVEKALNDFDLVEARDLKVGSPLNKVLSGGQRKRLNIALELMREPSILFVDEPTSGLSSSDSEKVMSLLKRQVLKGKLVIINIHQPNSDIYKLLDKLLIIDQGGYMVYNGNPMNAIVYFKKKAHYVNPEERECYMCGNVKTEQPLRIIEARMVDPSGKLIRKRKVTPQEWHESYQNEIEVNFDWKAKKAQKEKLPDNLYSIPGRRSQFCTFVLRDALKKIKDTQYMLLNILEVPVLAFLLAFATHYMTEAGYLFTDNSNLPTYLFMCTVVAIFVGLNGAAEEMIRDRKLLMREEFLNLSRTSYLLAKIVNLFGIALIQTILLVSIGHSIMGIGIELWPQHALILFSTFAFAIIFGLNISSGLKTVVAIYVSIPLVIVPQLVFSGTMVNFDRMHPILSNREYTPVIGDIMVSRWAYEAMAVEQFAHNAYEKHFFLDELERSRASYAVSTWLPEIERVVDECKRLSSQSELTEEQKATLTARRTLISNELKRVAKQMEDYKVGFMPDTIAIPHPSSPTHETEVTAAIAWLKNANQQAFRDANDRCDSTSQWLVDKLGSTTALANLKHRSANEALSRLAQSKDQFEQIVVYEDKMIRKRQPIFLVPENRHGRAQLYAPCKRLGHLMVPTLWFNCGIIWIFVGVLYVTLYFDLLRKALDRLENMRMQRIYRRLEKLRL